MKLYANVECMCKPINKPIRSCIGSFGHFTILSNDGDVDNNRHLFRTYYVSGTIISVSCILTFFFFFFWPCRVARGILVPRPGIEPVPPALEARSFNHWIAREVLY